MVSQFSTTQAPCVTVRATIPVFLKWLTIKFYIQISALSWRTYMACARQNMSDCQGVIAGVARATLASPDVCCVTESTTTSIFTVIPLAENSRVSMFTLIFYDGGPNDLHLSHASLHVSLKHSATRLSLGVTQAVFHHNEKEKIRVI
jgi:hypothetical protein